MTTAAIPPAAPLKVVFVGHVDHGKSTLVGRLIAETGSIADGKIEEIRAQCARRGMPFEWSFLLDALQAERDQGITIDTTQIWLRTERRGYVIIDAPGHKEFLKNMVTGAAAADAAILVVDAAEGVQEQSRRHGYLLHLLGVRQVAVAVNKMDLIGYDRARFGAIEREIRAYLTEIGVTPTAVIPVAGREGDNLNARSERMPWYGASTLVGALDRFEPAAPLENLPLRFPIQDVYKFDERRILAGRVESGRLAVGDTLLFSPSNKTARVKSIEAWQAAAPATAAGAGRSIGITIDQPLFIERGEWASHTTDPPIETDVCRAKLFWLGKNPIVKGSAYAIKLATSEVRASVQSIDRVIDATTLKARPGTTVERNEVAEVTLRFPALAPLDDFARLPRTGRFVLVDGYDIAGGGILSMDAYADQRALVTKRATNVARVEHRVTAAERAQRNGHPGTVLWLTGLSGSGKSTIAIELERRLFDRGYQVYVLDGDNLRHGLNADLGFSPEDRAENIRRVGELAALMARAGFIVVTAFISPYRSDRERARKAAGGNFHEVYVKASLAVCEGRDPKGLYKRARAGEIADFTGVSAPYEEPERPELVVDTERTDVELSVREVADYVVGLVLSRQKVQTD
jgi:bifunctional enzyme CysN/CysC